MELGDISSTPSRVGFVATRICGTDGVSLEIGKWAEIFQRIGHDCYYITGASDRAPEKSHLIDTADFLHPDIEALHNDCFGTRTRTVGLSTELHRRTQQIKNQLYQAISAFSLDLLIVQNALTIPLNIPLGAALVEVLAETRMPCIAHHHDFVWERERFLVNCVDDYLSAAFPPRLPQIQHVVINTLAGEEFSRRTGQSFYVIPNVMDFARDTDTSATDALQLRKALGVAPNEFLIVQPTRVVQRKGIEHTIELVRRLDDCPSKLVITHSTADEGTAYRDHLVRFSELMNVELIFADQLIGSGRAHAPGDPKPYSIWDVYPQADLVAYPSTYEGFGNAFVEATFYRRPIFCNRYTIYRTEIEPLGFKTLLMDGFVDEAVVNSVREILQDPTLRAEMVEHNFALGRRFFSFERLEKEIRSILARIECCQP